MKYLVIEYQLLARYKIKQIVQLIIHQNTAAQFTEKIKTTIEEFGLFVAEECSRIPTNALEKVTANIYL